MFVGYCSVTHTSHRPMFGLIDRTGQNVTKNNKVTKGTKNKNR